MERLNVVSAVANLQKEVEFYRQEYKECREIIKQLTGEGSSNGVRYINPKDLALMYRKALDDKNILLGVDGSSMFVVNGQRYKQSVNIPAVNKVLK
jgi:hypothetical protein